MKYLVIKPWRLRPPHWEIITVAVVGAFELVDPTENDRRGFTASSHIPALWVQAYDAGCKSCVVSPNTDRPTYTTSDGKIRQSHPTLRWYVKTKIEVINSHLDAHYLVED